MATSTKTKAAGSKSTSKKLTAAKASKASTTPQVVSHSSLTPGTMAGKLIVAPDAFSRYEYHDHGKKR